MTLAAVLRALALGFSNAAEAAEADGETPAAKPAAKPRKTTTAAEPATPVVVSTGAVDISIAIPAAAPAASAISKDKLNKAVLAVAGVDRDAAIKILAKHGASNTATLPAEKYQAVFDDMEEAKAQLDAKAAQASLV